MTEKAKRKSNPRRRTLIRLLVGIALIVALVYVGMLALRPKGAQIVFIAPDDNGVDNIWIADLNDPEHPRQLTQYTELNMLILDLLVVENGYIAVYTKAIVNQGISSVELWQINLQNGTQSYIKDCQKSRECALDISPTGQDVLSQENILIDDVISEIHLQLINLETNEITVIYEFLVETPDEQYHNSYARWIGESNIISINLIESPYDFVIFDLEQNRVIKTLPMGLHGRAVYFSPDGSRYSYQGISTNYLPTPLIVRSKDNPDDYFIEFDASDTFLASSLDWHSDSIMLIVSANGARLVDDEGNYVNFGNMYLLNTNTLESRTLLHSENHEFNSVHWNANANLILFEKQAISSYCDDFCEQISIYDIEGDEEIALPLFGHSPQWVNGGTLMEEKAKRKSNPRRQLLIRLLVGIALIVAQVYVGVYALRPKGAQIVFIAPDDDGIDQIWLADISNPKYQRQLTHHSDGSIDYLQVSNESSIVLYTFNNGSTESYYRELWRLNLDTGKQTLIMTCDDSFRCSEFHLHPTGEWVSYEEYTQDENGERIINVHVHNMDTSDDYVIYQVKGSFSYYYHPLPRWIGNTDLLVFRTNGNSAIDEFAIYSIEENRFFYTEVLNAPYWTPVFSDDGLHYAHYPNHMAVEPNPVSIRDMNNPNDLIYTTESITAGILDWHPDSERVLISEVLFGESVEITVRELNLYNIITGTKETILSNTNNISYFGVAFNAGASAFIYTTYNWNTDETQFMFYDMETREEIALPLFGRSPQWVNGGR